MGVTRKTVSFLSLGLVDFRSDKERIARSTRLTKRATKAGVREARVQTGLMRQDLELQQAMAFGMLEHEPPAAGWYPDEAGTQRWWDGTAWGQTIDVYQTPKPVTASPAGWYPDYAHPSRLRWYDGSAWTEHVS